ncbi:MAG: galactose ABC transporter substrate-binding protein [Clostridia bacterium]|nr:galactose ABC transporter substrate-binding protein [Clostridia bacterium]
MKRITVWMAVLLLALSSCLSARAAEGPVVGVCIYNGQDTFIQSMFSLLETQADGRAQLHIRDAANDQNKQNDQIGELLALGVDALVVNPVDRTGAVYLIDMAKKQGVPIIMVNREPLTSDLDRYALAYYVGIDPKEQGELSGLLAAEYFKNNPYADKNGDGVMQTVLLKGEPGHQDAELRTRYSTMAVQSAGVHMEILAQDTAMWERSLGQEKMAAFINTFGDRIECVLCNNDDMALGAIDALKAAGYFSSGKFMPVLGIDATAPALESLRAGTLYGSVVNDAFEQARAIIELALILSDGRAVTPENFPYEVNNKVVYIKSRVITKAILEAEN